MPSMARKTARMMAAAVTVGVALSTPAVCAADSSGAAPTDQAGHSTGTARDARGSAPGGRPVRTAPAPSAPAESRGTAHRSTATQSEDPEPATGTAARTRGQRPAAQQPAPRKTANSPVAEDEAPPETRTADPGIGAGTPTDTGSPAEAPAPKTEAPAPPVTAAAPAALTVAAVPAGAATAGGDLFSGLLAPIQAFFEGIGLLIRRTFFNQAPTVAPVQTTGQLVGPITGNIGAVDPEGDPLTYAVVVAPRYGTVEVTADGHYLYTPGTDFTGLDSFNVAVTDTGFHLNLLDPSRPASTEAFLQVAQNATLPMLTFTFVYGNGTQYWSAAARGALQDAAMLLATYVVVSTPTTIVYAVTGENSPSSSTLASAGSDLADPGTGFIATVVQSKIQTGVDPNGSAPDGDITWNFGNPWAFGTQVSTDEYDFTSTAMHELLHTLGFLSYTVEPGANTARSWTTFDQYVVTSDGTRVITDSYRWRSAYDTNLTGGAGGLFFGGPNAVAAYGGPVPLYTPDPWESGSSMSHLDDDTFTGAGTMLMNALTETGPGIRVVSPVELAILKDIGYTVTEPTPLQALLLIGFGLLRRRRDQRPVSWLIRL